MNNFHASFEKPERVQEENSAFYLIFT